MPKLIRNGQITVDSWLPAVAETPSVAPNQICTLNQWLQLSNKAGTAVQIDPADSPEPLFNALQEIHLIVVHFPVFTDGRGFSYARELRDRGYSGELRAYGHFIRDQISFLQRVGFNAFQFSDEGQLEEALSSLEDFTEFYQAAIDQPLPLFRRRSQ